MLLISLFVLTLALAFAALFHWAFRHLPREHWQVLATLPLRRAADGAWHCVNLTWYGFFTAAAIVIAVALALVMLAAIKVAPIAVVMLVIGMLVLCLPASRLIAERVEQQKGVHSVAAAMLVGTLAAPWLIVLVNTAQHALGAAPDAAIPVIPTLAAIAIAYAFGEGLGRLGCISFGCCYGRPVRDLPPAAQRLFSRFHFVFEGSLKKIAYAGNMAGERVVPVQAITAVLYVAAGLLSLYLFLLDHFATALILSLAVTQLWRAYSETLRADYRGASQFTFYQMFAIASTIYGIAMLGVFRDAGDPRADLGAGLTAIWQPGAIMLCLVIFSAAFYFYGRSQVTGSNLTLYVCGHRGQA